MPKKGHKASTDLFWLELKRVGKGSKAHWLVWSWVGPLATAIPRGPGRIDRVSDGRGLATRLLSSPRRRRRLRLSAVLLGFRWRSRIRRPPLLEHGRL